jgi:23S rRNA (cytidine1920-2'-O)/16S rRNA (cytidine1409-2'-O)-methyltransferase
VFKRVNLGDKLAGKIRLDQLLLKAGLASDLSLARRWIMAGQVRVNDQVVLKPDTPALPDAAITIDHGPRFVSRGGEKLQAALEAFALHVTESVCADVGASTGGFTDCLLQAGAARVYAIDVGSGILDWRLRQNPQVVVMEGTNARHIATLPEPIALVTIDASFISLKVLLPVVKGWFGSAAQVIALIKPQFEAGRNQSARARGVIRDPVLHQQILLDVLNFAVGENFDVLGLIRSPLVGPKGNVEFLAHLAYPGQGGGDVTGWLAGVG